MNEIKHALREIELGKVEEGLEQLSNLEQTADHQSLYEIAEVYHQLGHIEKAKKIIDELLLFYPDEGSLYAYAAELLIDMDEEDEAIELLLEVREDDEAYLQAQLLLADLYQMQSLDEAAERRLLLAVKKAPDEPIILYGLGEFYLERGDYIKSIPYLKKAMHKKEQLPDLRLDLRLAEAYSASGQFEDAFYYYRIGLEHANDPYALFGYGFTAFQLRDYVVAIKQLKELKELDPDFSSLYPLLAKAYEAEGYLDRALNTLEEGLKIDEYNEQLYIHAAKLNFKRQNPNEGERLLRHVIALNPSNVEAVQTLASYLKHQEMYEELLDLLNHVKKLGEEDNVYTWYAAAALKELDQFEEAYHRFQEVEKGFENDPEFLEEYGYFLLEYGLRDEAMDQFKKLVKIQPERVDIKEQLELF
ncbi:tetratricopeptide repeat protein [bacterium LRH843]|nr:tetratricopeptide repeat protein [bacterium LRH843]